MVNYSCGTDVLCVIYFLLLHFYSAIRDFCSLLFHAIIVLASILHSCNFALYFDEYVRYITSISCRKWAWVRHVIREFDSHHLFTRCPLARTFRNCRPCNWTTLKFCSMCNSIELMINFLVRHRVIVGCCWCEMCGRVCGVCHVHFRSSTSRSHWRHMRRVACSVFLLRPWDGNNRYVIMLLSILCLCFKSDWNR